MGYLKSGVQTFLPSAKHIYDKNEKIKKVDYYFLHPALDKTLQVDNQYQDFYNEFNIVGNGNQFCPPPPNFKNLWEKNDLAYFLPKSISGHKGLKDVNPNMNLQVSLYELYLAFYEEKEMEDLVQFKENMFPNLFKIMTAIADVHFISLLNDNFKGNKIFSEGKQEKETLLLNCSFNNSYSSLIKDSVSSENLLKFGKRLIGRFVSAGLWAFLKLDPKVIKFIITDFVYDPEHAKRYDGEAAVKFLRNNLYLKDLKTTCPLTDEDSETFVKCLSMHEQENLQEWWTYYKYHQKLKGIELTKEHEDFLRNQFY